MMWTYFFSLFLFHTLIRKGLKALQPSSLNFHEKTLGIHDTNVNNQWGLGICGQRERVVEGHLCGK